MGAGYGTMHLMKQSQCLHCSSSPTVNSHIAPRALFLDIKGDEKTLVGGQQGRPGVQLKQNGLSDQRILCTVCEGKLGRFDGYGTEFVRKVNAFMPGDGVPLTTIDNPYPDRLVGFVLACIWRSLASETDCNPARLLGPYEASIRKILFEGGDHTGFPCIVMRTDIRFGANRGAAFIGPVRAKLWGATSWKISILGMDAIVKTSRDRWEAFTADYDVGRNDPATVLISYPVPIEAARSLHPVIETMKNSGWRSK